MKKVRFQTKQEIVDFVIDYLDKNNGTFICDFDLAKKLRDKYEDYNSLDYCSVELHSNVDMYLVSVISNDFIIEAYNENLITECSNLIILDKFLDVLDKILVENEIMMIEYGNKKLLTTVSDKYLLKIYENKIKKLEDKVQELENKLFKNKINSLLESSNILENVLTTIKNNSYIYIANADNNMISDSTTTT